MGQVIQLYSHPSRIENLAQNYVRIYLQQGWVPAGKYLNEYVPEQFWPQVARYAERILLRKGIEVF